MSTVFAINPTTGKDHAYNIEGHGSPHGIAFLASDDAALRDAPDVDPREPIPFHEASPISTIDSGAIDAVADAPITGEALASQQDQAADVSPLSAKQAAGNNFLSGTVPGGDHSSGASAGSYVDYVTRGGDLRPQVSREMSSGTISNLYVPGGYPKE